MSGRSARNGGWEHVDHPVYGEASPTHEHRVFFKRDPGHEERFSRLAPWSHVSAPLLRFHCPQNVEDSGSTEARRRHDHGVVQLRLDKMAAGPTA